MNGFCAEEVKDYGCCTKKLKWLESKTKLLSAEIFNSCNIMPENLKIDKRF